MIVGTIPCDPALTFLEFSFVSLVFIISSKMHSKLIELQLVLHDR